MLSYHSMLLNITHWAFKSSKGFRIALQHTGEIRALHKSIKSGFIIYLFIFCKKNRSARAAQGHCFMITDQGKSFKALTCKLRRQKRLSHIRYESHYGAEQYFYSWTQGPWSSDPNVSSQTALWGCGWNRLFDFGPFEIAFGIWINSLQPLLDGKI